jgi:hypothetical protein
MRGAEMAERDTMGLAVVDVLASLAPGRNGTSGVPMGEPSPVIGLGESAGAGEGASALRWMAAGGIRSRGAVVSWTAGLSASPAAMGLTRRARGSGGWDGGTSVTFGTADVMDALVVAGAPRIAAVGAGAVAAAPPARLGVAGREEAADRWAVASGAAAGWDGPSTDGASRWAGAGSSGQAWAAGAEVEVRR